MKKISKLFFYFIVLISIQECSGYKPIFSSSNMQFTIADYSLEGDTKLANQIYSKLYNLTKANDSSVQSINININVLKEKKPTSKDSTGKILEYRIALTTDVLVNDYLTNAELLNYSFNSDFSYRVQGQYSETKKLESKAINNLINKTYQDLLIKIVENISRQ